MEDVLMAAREGSHPLAPVAIETLFVADGVLRLMLGLVPDAGANVTEAVARLRTRLDALLGGAPVAAAALTPVEARAASPVEPVAAAAPPLAARLDTPRPAAPRSEPGRPPRQTIRVNLERLDSLMNLIGEMVIGRERVDRRLDEIDRVSASLLASRARLAQYVADYERREFDPRHSMPGAKPAPTVGLSAAEP